MGSPCQVRYSSRSSSRSSESCNPYFDNYVPLSNLPTPPLSAYDWPRDEAYLDLEKDSCGAHLAGPATHLSRLIPSAACLHDPSVLNIHSYLRQAKLPIETIALAACVLDSLSTRFAQLWRRECPTDVPDPPHDHNLLRIPTSTPCCQPYAYIEPEVIVLAALSLAVACLDDRHVSTRYWAQSIAKGNFTCGQINTTRRCILLDLNHQIQPLCSAQLIEETIEDMEQVTASLERLSRFRPKPHKESVTPPRSACNGTAFPTKELPTPEPSPTASLAP
ncbi:MAG: hypothetical protein M1812_004055 [Candelaria pacifica]|nr:MAG: hypothetical protein M1812_004055 [Candelaria pacifica]